MVLDLVDGLEITLNVHHGEIKNLDVKGGLVDETLEDVRLALVGTKLQDVSDWTMLLQANIEPFNQRCTAISKRLEELLPVPEFPRT